MDSQERQGLSIDDILDQPGFTNRLLFNARELSDRFSEKSYLDFNIDESLDNYIKNGQIPLPLPLEPDQCHSIREQICDDTNHLEDLQDSNLESGRREQLSAGEAVAELKEERREGEDNEVVQGERLEQIIVFLVKNGGLPRDESINRLELRFPLQMREELVLDLVQKFVRLKKTKQELVKYCMRKAFKFILQLPKNKHLLDINKQEKFSFSKCKNRFLRNISEEKSMNNKFLQQIFQEKDFSEDYHLFLQHFDHIMREDNSRKIKCLAEMLTGAREGKVKGVEMVRRLPWTQTILERVGRISRQLLKYSGQR